MYLLMILFIGVACQEEKVQNNEEPKEEMKDVKMAALNVCGDTEDADILLLCTDGSYILCDAENHEGYSVIYMNDSINNDFENGLTVFLDEKGMPVMATSSKGTFVFKNVTDDSFDCAFIDNQNEISYYNNIQFDFQRMQSRSSLTTRSIFDPWIDSWRTLTSSGWDEHNKKAIVPFLCKIASFAITAGNTVLGKDYIGFTHTFLNEIYKSGDYKNEWLDNLFYATGMTSLSLSGIDLKNFINNGNVVFTPKKFGLSYLAYLLNEYGDNQLEKLGQIEEWIGPHFDTEEWRISLSTNLLECYPDDDWYLVDVSSKAEWAIDTSQIDHNWCEVKKLDVQVAVHVKPNEQEYDRTCELIIKPKYTSEISPVTLTIKQSGIVFNLHPNTLTFSQAGGRKGFAIISNENISSWSVSSYPSWCKIEKNGDYSYWVIVEKNEEDEKKGIITVTGITKGGMPVDRTLIVEQKYQLCPDNKHPHLIDLGLPSGTKWACCNIGATKPEDKGYFFAWGDTSPKSSFGWNNYIYWTDLDGNGIVYDEEIKELGDDISGTSYDAAKANWGGTWRMPTSAEYNELIQYTGSTLYSSEIDGRYLIGKNGNRIIMPCNPDNYEYWTSTMARPGYFQSNIGNRCAYCFRITYDWVLVGLAERCDGRFIRPVSD